jgi:hypothetical protein
MGNPTIDSALSASSAVAVVLLAPTILGFGLLFSPSAAAQVYRCEAADGRITYTNERCPSTARRTRTVDDSPPVQAQSDRPATNKAPPAGDTAAKTETESLQAGAAKSEAVKAEPVKDSAKAAAPARARASGATVTRVPTAANLSPAQQMEQLDRERDRQRIACDQLQRRIDFAHNDFETATDGQRASYELQLRRLQEDYLAQCPKQR